MTFIHPGPVSVATFLSTVAFILIALLTGVFAASRRLGQPATRRTILAALGVLIWLAATSAVVASGALAARPMPAIPLFFAAVLAAALGFGLSPVGKTLALGLPIPALVAFQVFRLPLELVLHSWAGQGAIPETMTWTGRNFDIFSGIVSLLAAPLAARWRGAAWVANAVGLVLLVNVGRVAMLSSPLPFAWDVERARSARKGRNPIRRLPSA